MRWPSKCVAHEPCEACGSRDNKAIYDDGHSYCFGCQKYSPPKGRRMPVVNTQQPKFPDDLTSEIPSRFKNWLEVKGLTPAEIKTYYSYSPELDRIVHNTRSQNGEFAEAKSAVTFQVPKVIQFGHKPYRIYGNLDDSGVLVIVEDLISAIKVGRTYGTMPLFGAHLPTDVMSLIARNCDIQEVVIWLDHDKFHTSSHYGKQLSSLGVKAAAFYTFFDPKHYTNKEIKERVDEVLQSMSKDGQQRPVSTRTLPETCCKTTTGDPSSKEGEQRITEGMSE